MVELLAQSNNSFTPNRLTLRTETTKSNHSPHDLVLLMVMLQLCSGRLKIPVCLLGWFVWFVGFLFVCFQRKSSQCLLCLELILAPLADT